ncbi:MAG: hypothetical protein H3Z50_01405 [archaeon]|nr:hypothetical protein [archaeon]
MEADSEIMAIASLILLNIDHSAVFTQPLHHLLSQDLSLTANQSDADEKRTIDLNNNSSEK